MMRTALVTLAATGLFVSIIIPAGPANAGTISVFCWSGNLGPLPAPVPTIGCTGTTNPSAGGGQAAFMSGTSGCTPNCSSTFPTYVDGPVNANLPRSLLRQVEQNCAGSNITGIITAQGYTLRYERDDPVLQVWSSDSRTASVAFYCPGAIPQSSSFAP